MYTIFFILLITITCVVVNINRKEQNKTEEKKTECAEMQLFEYPTQYSQVSGNHYFYLRKMLKVTIFCIRTETKKFFPFAFLNRN